MQGEQPPFIDFGQGLPLNGAMNGIGERIELEGTLIRDGAGFALRAERGILYHLQLHRVPVDHVEKRVRVVGTLIEERLVEAEGVAPC